MITIELLRTEDAEALFDFECENRAFFEQTVPSRGDDYYRFAFFIDRHKELMDEQAAGGSRFYLIRNRTGRIAGRINVTEIDQIHQEGDLGFRIGKEFAGRGIAALAVKKLLEKETDIQKFTAKTTSVNVASQKVLEKNGFRKTEKQEAPIELNGEKLTFVHYEWLRS